jgi:ABC-type uncharacterized transport system permease subunit
MSDTSALHASTSPMAQSAPSRPRRGLSSARSALSTAGIYALSIGVALALCAILVSTTGGSARAVFSAMLDGSLRSPGAWGLTLTTATPLLIVAVGSIVCSKAGLTNIGQEGQLLLGIAATAYVGVRLDAPGPIVIVAAFLAAAIAGAIWAGIAALMRFTRQVPEVISTLLLVFLAANLTTFGLDRTWLLLNRSGEVSNTNSGDPLPTSVRMPLIRIFGNEVSSGLVVALALSAVVAFVLGRTTWGFRLRMLGMNPRTARRAGVSAVAYGGAAMLITGAFAGAAGTTWLLGGAAGTRFTSGISSNIGWQGLQVALLAREKPILAVPMAFIFAMLRTGSNFLAATGVERRIADVVQALLVLALLVPPAVDAIRKHRISKVATL